jgi:hypothetical protein
VRGRCQLRGHIATIGGLVVAAVAAVGVAAARCGLCGEQRRFFLRAQEAAARASDAPLCVVVPRLVQVRL